MDWFLYDRDPRHERVNGIQFRLHVHHAKVYIGPCKTSVMQFFC